MTTIKELIAEVEVLAEGATAVRNEAGHIVAVTRLVAA
jgi:hypothetical protein